MNKILRFAVLPVVCALSAPGAALAAWQATGPDGGSLTDLWIDPADTSHLLATSATNGLFDSWDGGQLFIKVPGSPLDESYTPAITTRPTRVIADPTNANRLFLGTGWGGLRSGVYRSDDRGSSWYTINTGLVDNPLPYVGDLGFSKDGAVLYAATSKGLYVSFDRVSWTHIPIIGLNSAGQVAPSNNNPDRVYLTSSTGIFRSDDAGVTWMPASGGLANLDIDSFSADPDPGERLFQSSTNGQIDVSDDFGANWSPVVAGLIDAAGFVARFDSIVAQGGSDRVFALTQGRVFRSDDNGANWAGLDLPFDIDAGNRLILDPASNQRVYLAASTGLYRSDDGGQTWAALNVGIRAHIMSNVHTGPVDHSTWFAEGASVFRSSNGGASWTDVGIRTSKDDYIFRLAPSHGNPNLYYAASDQVGPIRSTDAGQTWGALTPLPTPAQLSFSAWVDPANDQNVIMASLGSGAFSMSFAGFYRSTDGGLSWTWTFPAPLDRINFQPNSVVDDPTTPGIVYFGVHSRTEQAFTDGLVLRSTDHGASFDIVLDGMAFTQVMVDAGGIVYAGGSTLSKKQGVWRSLDDGATWEQVSNGLPLPFNTTDLAAHPTQAGHVFTASITGDIFESRNAGLSWHLLEGIGNNARVGSIAVIDDPAGDYMMIAGTQGNVYVGRNLESLEVRNIPALDRPGLLLLSLLVLAGAGLMRQRFVFLTGWAK